MHDKQQLADMRTVREAIREEVNGRLDRQAEHWERRFEEHKQSCNRYLDTMEGRIKNGDAQNKRAVDHYSDDFHKFLEEEWSPVKKIVLDFMAWTRLTAKLLAGAAVLAGVLIAIAQLQ